MNTTPDDGEHRVKEWLRRKIDAIPGPFGRPAPEPAPQSTLATTPGIHVTVHQPPGPPLWLAADPAAEDRRKGRIYPSGQQQTGR